MKRVAIVIVVIAVALTLVIVARPPVAARGPIATLEVRATADKPWIIDRNFDGLVFARVGEEFDHRAAIFPESEHEVALPDSFTQSGWKDARPLCGAIYAVADVDVESPGPSFEIVKHDGMNWLHLASIPKPHYYAYFETLTCEDGTLRLRAVFDTEVIATDDWLSRFKDFFSRRARGEVFVDWTSTDGGETWRGPVITPTQ